MENLDCTQIKILSSQKLQEKKIKKKKIISIFLKSKKKKNPHFGEATWRNHNF